MSRENNSRGVITASTTNQSGTASAAGSGNVTSSSVVGTSNSANSAITIATNQDTAKYPSKENPVEEEIDDDSDFVLVVNRKKQHSNNVGGVGASNADSYHNNHHYHHNFRHHNKSYHHHYRQQQQSHYNDGGGGSGVSGDENQNLTSGHPQSHHRRRRFKDYQQYQPHDRDNSSQSGPSHQNKPFRGGRGSTKSKDKFGSNHNTLSSQPQDNNKENNTTTDHQIPSSSSTEQIEKTGNNPLLSSSSPNTNASKNIPPVKTFSLVVAAGTAASSSNTFQNGGRHYPSLSSANPTTTRSSPLSSPQQVSQDQPLYSTHLRRDNLNGCNTTDLSTNRQILLVIKGESETDGNSNSIQAAATQQLQEGTPSSCTPPSVVTERSSSIPDTSSLTSEETLDSCSGVSNNGGGRGKSDSQEQQEPNDPSTHLEYVEAPVPKVNPWVVNRNAAQVIVSGSTVGSTQPVSSFSSNTDGVSKKSTLMGFPSVSESFPEALSVPLTTSIDEEQPNGHMTKTAMKQQQPQQANSNNKQTGTNTKMPIQNSTQTKQLQALKQQPLVSSTNSVSSHSSGNAVTSSSNASSPKTTKISFAHAAVGTSTTDCHSKPNVATSSAGTQTQPSLFQKTAGSLTTTTTSTTTQLATGTCTPPPPPPPFPPLQTPAIYYREMANGFRPGRGRGSYSASASAGRKIPSRSQVLMMKVAGGNQLAEDVVDGALGNTKNPSKSLHQSQAVSVEWPTLGEAVKKFVQPPPSSQPGPCLKTVTSEESSVNEEKTTSSRSMEKERDNCEQPKTGNKHVEEDHSEAVQSAKPDSGVSAHPVPIKETSQHRQKVRSNSTPSSSSTSSNEEASSDHECEPNHNFSAEVSSENNKTGNNSNSSSRRASKQKWVPLDLTEAHQQNNHSHQPSSLPHHYTDAGNGRNKTGGGKGGKGKYYYSYHYQHQQNNHYNSSHSYYHGGRGKGKDLMNGHAADYMETDRHSHAYPPSVGSSRGMRGGSRGGGRRSHHHASRRQATGGIRPASSLSLNAQIGPLLSSLNHPHHQHSGSNNNSHAHIQQAPHHHRTYDFELLSPTGSSGSGGGVLHSHQQNLEDNNGGVGGSYVEFRTDFSTLTPMYPAISDFIMPYVTNGYFPTPYTPPPAGLIVDATGTGSLSVAVSVSGSNGSALIDQQQQHIQEPQKQNSNSEGDSANDLSALTDQVRSQLEYYFSEVNLAKDFFLRRQMNEEGFLPVYLLANFPRVKSMTQSYTIVLNAIQSSEHLELNQDLQSVRAKKDPQKWPILDSGNTIISGGGGPQQPNINNNFSNHNHLNNQPSISLHSSSASSTAVVEFSSSSYASSSSSSSSQSGNNNHHHDSDSAFDQEQHAPSSLVAPETLNPNVPEFVPKSNVALY